MEPSNWIGAAESGMDTIIHQSIDYEAQWGEFEPYTNPVDVAQIEALILGAIKLEDPKNKLPVTTNDESIKVVDESCNHDNDIVSQTIKCHQHAREMVRLIREVARGNMDIVGFPPVPECVRTKRGPIDVNQENLRKEDFKVGISTPEDFVHKETIVNMTHRLLCVTLAHAGFFKASREAFLIYQDAYKSFMQRFLANIADVIKSNNPDLLEKALRDLGHVRGVKMQSDYYALIIKKRDRAVELSKKLITLFTQVYAAKEEDMPSLNIEETISSYRPILPTRPSTSVSEKSLNQF